MVRAGTNLGSAEYTAPTSFHNTTLWARSAAPTKQAVVSAPRPSRVVIPLEVFSGKAGNDGYEFYG